MKETEITVQVFDTLEAIDKKLKAQDFKIIEKYSMKDWYFSKYDSDTLLRMTYQEILKNSIIVRNIIEENNEIKQIVYKDKVIDRDGNVIAEEKSSSDILDVQGVVNVLNKAGLNNWNHVYNSTLVYGKDDICFCVQEIADLGIFIEYEEDKTVEGLNNEEKFEKLANYIKSLNLNIGNNFSCKKVYMKFLKEKGKI